MAENQGTRNPQIDLNLRPTELRLGPPLGSPDDFNGSASGSDGPSMAHQNNSSSPQVHASKAQAVGWPPIRSFRKSTMAATRSPKTLNNADSGGCLYVKVSMDNAPYLRMVDINTFRSYAELSSALEHMFSCFIIETRLKDVQNSEQCVITYEDRDGDWMLVGDVPWDMFTNTCRRLRITKSKEAIGLAPQVKGKCTNKD